MKNFFGGGLPLLVLGIALTGCGKKTAPASQPQTDKEPPVVENKEVFFNGSLDDLMKLDENYRCVMNVKDNEYIVSAVTYVADGKIRNDNKLDYDDKIRLTHSIITEDWIYSWSEEEPDQGTKIKVSDLEKYQKEGDENIVGVYGHDVDYDYKCYSWKVDESKFQEPVGINFMDVTSILEQAGSEQ